MKSAKTPSRQLADWCLLVRLHPDWLRRPEHRRMLVTALRRIVSQEATR